jgi:hypothetical protein
LWIILVSLCAGRLLNDAICAAVFGGVALKPEADNMFSLNSVLLVQAATAAHSPKTAGIDFSDFNTFVPLTGVS